MFIESLECTRGFQKLITFNPHNHLLRKDIISANLMMEKLRLREITWLMQSSPDDKCRSKHLNSSMLDPKSGTFSTVPHCLYERMKGTSATHKASGYTQQV